MRVNFAFDCWNKILVQIFHRKPAASDRRRSSGLQSQCQAKLGLLVQCLRINLSWKYECWLRPPFMLHKSCYCPIIVHSTLHGSESIQCIWTANSEGIVFWRQLVCYFSYNCRLIRDEIVKVRCFQCITLIRSALGTWV